MRVCRSLSTCVCGGFVFRGASEGQIAFINSSADPASRLFHCFYDMIVLLTWADDSACDICCDDSVTQRQTCDLNVHACGSPHCPGEWLHVANTWKQQLGRRVPAASVLMWATCSLCQDVLFMLPAIPCNACLFVCLFIAGTCSIYDRN